MPRTKVAIPAAHLEKLKQQVAQTFGKPISTKPDCVALSDEVQQRTGVYLSESTLRRFFGLIASPSQPSLQTLDTLAQSIGCDNWHAFINQQVSWATLTLVPEPVQWEVVRSKAHRISEISLRRIKEGLGLPYEVTSSRPLVQELLRQFAGSPQTALCLYAPSGSGKSTLLAHWVEQQARTEDIIWLVSGNALAQLLQQGFSLESWLYQSLGVSSTANILQHFHCQPAERLGAMWLVMDDFSFQQIRSDRCVDFYRSLLSFIQEVHTYSWFKVVLSVQVPLWQQVIAPLRQQLQQTHCWYTVAEVENSAEGNLPPLSRDEIEQVTRAYHTYYPDKQINRDLIALPFHTQELLRNPFFLQLYLTADHSSNPEAIDELSLVELFVREQIERGPYAYEKLHLTRRIISLVAQHQLTNSVVKKELLTADSSAAAYEELLNAGILEESLELRGLFDTDQVVRFANTKVLAYSVVSYYLQQHHNRIDLDSVKQLSRLFERSEVLPEILRWLILLGFREENVVFLSQFFDLNFPFAEKTYNDSIIFHLVTTLGIQLRRHAKLREKLWPIYAQHPLGQAYYFEFFVDIDYLVLHHYEGLTIYAQQKATPEARLFANCLLFLKGFLSGNHYECQAAHLIITQIEPDLSIHPTPLGRRFACLLLYEHYYGGGIKSETIDHLHEIEKQMPQSGTLGRHLPTYHTIVSEALIWCERYADAHLVLKHAERRYATDETFVGASFHHQGLLNLTNVQLYLRKIKQSRATFGRIKPYLFNVHSRQYNLISYYLLESLLHQSSGADEEAQHATKKATKIAKALKYDGMLKNIFPLYDINPVSAPP